MRNPHPALKRDADPQETQEWVDALGDVLDSSGEARTRYIIRRLIEHAQLINPTLQRREAIPSIFVRARHIQHATIRRNRQ